MWISNYLTSSCKVGRLIFHIDWICEVGIFGESASHLSYFSSFSFFSLSTLCNPSRSHHFSPTPSDMNATTIPSTFLIKVISWIQGFIESRLKASDEEFWIQIGGVKEFTRLSRPLKIMKKLNRTTLEAPRHRAWQTKQR